MINIDIHPDPTPNQHSTNPFVHNNPPQRSPNTLHPLPENDRQDQNDFYNNPSHSPIQHPFQKKSSLNNHKSDDSEAEDQQGNSNGIES